MDAVGKKGRVPILSHPVLSGRLANVKTAPLVPTLCTENKFFWYQLKFGRKWLLGGRKLDSTHISAGRRRQESSYLGLNRVTKKRGLQLPIPDSIEGQPTPPGYLG